MKKVVFIIISILTILTYNNVYAKDIVKSINKYNEESLKYILNSYNENHEKDGIVSAGTFLKEKVKIEDEEYNDTQVILLKYNNKGKVIWKYVYGKTADDQLLYLTYSYDAEKQIDGYLLFVNKTYDIGETVEVKPVVIKIDLKGQYVEEKEILSSNITINKIINSYNNENIIDGYILIGQKDNRSFISKFDLSLNELWTKYFSEEYLNITDIVMLRQDNIPKEYIAIVNTPNSKLINIDLEGNVKSILKEDFEEKDNPKVISVDNSFILYGITNEVKLSNDKNTSFYIIKYNTNYEEEWETVGDIPINNDGVLELYPVYSKDQIKEYLMMSTNSSDSSVEITRIDLEGNIKNKVKKIKNDYYNISSFIFDNKTLYLIGEIKCQEDDICEYETNSLLLISDEDKVIEVKETDNSKVFIALGGFILVIITMYIILKYKKQK